MVVTYGRFFLWGKFYVELNGIQFFLNWGKLMFYDSFWCCGHINHMFNN
jgi:hypothetical protein